MNLTYEEYEELSLEPVSAEEFDKLLKRAITTLNVVTRYFYNFNSFDGDFDFRKAQVKAALAFQIDYFNETGATTFESLNNVPQTVSLGRTTITQSSSRVADNTRVVPVVSNESLQALSGTGLLNRGVYNG